MKWLFLFAGIFCNAAASVLVKIALGPGQPLFSIAQPFALLKNIPLLTGLFFYGATFILYALSLMQLPLNVAHPVMTSGAVAVVALCSVLIFRESFYWTTGLGVLLVIGGVWLITLRAH